MSKEEPFATREDLAWAGGLFEGEGCLAMYVKPKRNGTGRCVPAIHAQLGSTDLDVLEKFASIVGVGHLTGPYAHKGRKTSWTWQTGKFEHVQALVAMLWPWLGRRRRVRAREIIRARIEHGWFNQRGRVTVQ